MAERGEDDIVRRMKRELCSRVMEGNWNEVVEIYNKCANMPEVRRMKITQSGGTALHMAVYEGDKKTVEKLLNLIKKSDLIDTDGDTENRADDRGNTALHLAAKMGYKKMCNLIALKVPDIIGYRNKDSETPLFFAALHGKKNTFSLLCLICCHYLKDGWDKIYEYGRRNSDGRTVLHCAIDGEYFGLAYQIIVRYPRFLYSVDERGYTPLHLLATKHSAFKSSSGRTWMPKFIYNCIPAKQPSVTEDKPNAINYLEPSKKATDEENPQPKFCPPPIHSPARVFIKRLLKSVKSSFASRISITYLVHIVEMKEKHLWAVAIKDILLQSASYYDYLQNGSKPQSETDSIFNQISEGSHLESNQNNRTQKDTPSLCGSFSLSFPHTKQGIDVAKLVNSVTDTLVSLESSQKNQRKTETPVLIAAKNGISEIVEHILRKFPVAIHDVDSAEKNLILMAVENRQPQIYQLLLKNKVIKSVNDLFLGLDNDGNSALHLAAMLKTYQPWRAPNAILQMQWEIKWYKCIEEKMPKHLLGHQNKEGKTAEDIFLETHSELVKIDTDWLMKTSDSCTIVAALIATVAFATLASVPGGTKTNGEPVLKRERMFEVFSIASLGALCFSLTAVVMFLAILSSRHQPADFGSKIPTKLITGLTALFLSIASVLVCFCGGHFFILKDVLRHAKVAEYTVAVVPVAVFVIAQCPLYFRLIWATMKKVPGRGFMVTTGGDERGGPTRRAETSPKLRITTTVSVNEPSPPKIIDEGPP